MPIPQTTPRRVKGPRIAHMRPILARYLAACRNHPPIGPLTRNQTIEANNVTYWRARIEEAER